MKKIFLSLSLLFCIAANSQIITDTGTLRTRINADIGSNGSRAITGPILNRILNGYLYSWPDNRVNALPPLNWNPGTRTLTLPGYNATNWNTVYAWYLTNPVITAGIQNQTAIDQAAAFRISGNGTAGAYIGTLDNPFQYSPANTYGWEIAQRIALKASNLPVASFRPTTASTNMSFAIMPNGTPGNWGTQPITWLDVVDADIKAGTPAYNAARVGISSTAGVFGTWPFNGATGKPVEIYASGTKVVDLGIDADHMVKFSSNDFTITGNPASPVSAYVMNTNNGAAGADALLYVGSILNPRNYGFIRWNNAFTPPGTQVYRNPNQFDVLANTGNTNGMALGSLQNTPIKFIQGANANGNEVARFNDNGHFGIGVNAPTAWLNIKSSDGTGGTAPLKFSPGTLLTNPESGAVEFNGSHFYGTIGTTRYQLDQQSGGVGGTYTPGPGIDITGGVISSTEFYKNYLLRNASGAGNRIIYNKTNDSTTSFRPIYVHGSGITVDTTASDSAHIDINLNVSGGSGGGDYVKLLDTVITNATQWFAYFKPYWPTYSALEIKLEKLIAGSQTDHLYLQVSANDMSTFDAATGNYFYSTIESGSDLSGPQCEIIKSFDNVAGRNSAGTIYFDNGNINTLRPLWRWDFKVASFSAGATHIVNVTGAGERVNAQLLDGVRLFSNGGLLSCRMKIYGKK